MPQNGALTVELVAIVLCASDGVARPIPATAAMASTDVSRDFVVIAVPFMCRNAAVPGLA
jgi:hypothetical protein